MSALGRITRGEANIDYVGKWRVWSAISGTILLLSLIGLLVSKLNLGQEFVGGTSLRVSTVEEVTIAEVEDVLAPFELEDVKVQLSFKPDPVDPLKQQQEILVRSAHIDDRAVFVSVQGAIADVAGRTLPNGDPDLDQVSIEDVGPLWGRQVSTKALQGLVIFLILVTLYISVRFEWKMALGAIAALIHDLVATAGLYALVGFIVTPATVIALLTLLGYSLYDTVVVFDKVRENGETLSGSGQSYTEMVNASANQVTMRSINTSLSTMLPIGSLLFVGVFVFKADTLKDLALAMFIGTLVGTYSSLFVAVPLLAKLKEREPRYRQLRERTEGKRVKVAATSAPAPTAEGVDEEVAQDADAAGVPEPRAPRPHVRRPTASSQRPRGQKRRKRRR